jgi:hypothetical protein
MNDELWKSIQFLFNRFCPGDFPHYNSILLQTVFVKFDFQRKHTGTGLAGHRWDLEWTQKGLCMDPLWTRIGPTNIRGLNLDFSRNPGRLSCSCIFNDTSSKFIQFPRPFFATRLRKFPRVDFVSLNPVIRSNLNRCYNSPHFPVSVIFQAFVGPRSLGMG